MLGKRALTALALALAVGATIFFGPTWAPVLILAALLLAGAWEWSRLVGAEPPVTTRLAYLAVAVVAMAAGWWGSADALTRAVVWGIAGAWWLFALIWLFSRSAAPGAGSPARRIPAVLIYLAGLAAMVPAWLALGRVHVMSPGPWALVVVIAIVVAADIGAYFTGKLFGRHRLLPSVSPGKTWEGLFGGLAFASAVGWAAALSGVPLPPGMPVVAFCIALISVLGDLTVSLFKRNAGVKHSGTLLPGHGGVLDRIDSFCSAAPAWAVWITLTTDWL